MTKKNSKQCWGDLNKYVILLKITHPLMEVTFMLIGILRPDMLPQVTNVSRVTLVIKQSQPAAKGEILLTFEIDHNLNRFYHCLLAPCNLPHRGHNDTSPNTWWPEKNNNNKKEHTLHSYYHFSLLLFFSACCSVAPPPLLLLPPCCSTPLLLLPLLLLSLSLYYLPHGVSLRDTWWPSTLSQQTHKMSVCKGDHVWATWDLARAWSLPPSGWAQHSDYRNESQNMWSNWRQASVLPHIANAWQAGVARGSERGREREIINTIGCQHC